MKQVFGVTLDILIKMSAALSLDFQQGLILIGRQLIGDSKFICYWACAMNEIQSPVYLLS